MTWKRWKEWGAIAGATAAMLGLMALVWGALGLDFPPWAAQARTMQMAAVLQKLCDHQDVSDQNQDFLSLGFFQDRLNEAEARLREAPSDGLAVRSRDTARTQVDLINTRLNARVQRTRAGCE